MPTSLYLTYDGLTDPLGQSQILPYILGLADKGHNFHIISFEKKQNYNLHKAEIERLIKNKSIAWHPLTYHKSPPVLSTFYDILQLRKSAKKLVKKHDIQIIHCRSYITSLVGVWLKRRYKLKFIFDMRGFWAEERMEGGIWNRNNPLYEIIYRFFKKKEKQFLHEADAIVSLTENAKAEINNILATSTNLKINQTTNPKITPIPCSVDLELFQPRERQTDVNLADTLGIGAGGFTLLYLGSLGTWYMLDKMLDYFDHVAAVHPAPAFLLLTPDKDLLAKTLKYRKWKTKKQPKDGVLEFGHPQFRNARIVVTQAPRKSVPDYIQLCEASIMFIMPTYSKKASSATKMGEVLAMNKPVITNAGWGDVDRLAQACDQILLVRQFNEQAYRQNFQELKATVAQPSNTARTFAEANFALQRAVSSYQAIYDRLYDE